MRSIRARVSFAFLAATLVSGFGMSASHAAQASCTYGSSVPETLPLACSAPGTLIEVTGNDQEVDGSLPVPLPGFGVGATGTGAANGASIEMSLRTALDGSVSANLVIDEGSMQGGGDAAHSGNSARRLDSPSACDDSAFNLWTAGDGGDLRWISTFSWYLHSNNLPSS